MPKLDDTARAFIVKALSCYDTPKQVAEQVKEEFGITLQRHQVQIYDPTKVASKNLAKKWRDLFDATRKRFLERVSEIPIANQATRLRMLERLLRRAEAQGNVMIAAQLLEQAAKEVGGAYTDRRRVVGDPSQPVGVHHSGKVEISLSDAELERIARGGN